MLKTQNLLKWILNNKDPENFSHDWANENPTRAAEREELENVLSLMVDINPNYLSEAPFDFENPIIHFNEYLDVAFNFIEPQKLIELKELPETEIIRQIRKQQIYDGDVSVGMLAYSHILQEDFKWINENIIRDFMIDFFLIYTRTPIFSE